ncbi:MAG: PRTRC system protein E [Bryobacteraceae bacterium]
MDTTPGLFNGLAPLLTNRTVIMTVSADANGMLTLTVIPKKVTPDESDALTTPLWITATADELDRTLPDQLREYCAVHGQTASNLQSVKAELAAAEKAERDAADERRARKAKTKTPPPPVAPSLFDDQQQQQGEVT